MDQRFRKINMEDVRNIIDQKGFYYLPLSRVYDEFYRCSPKKLSYFNRADQNA